jgi:hypothetical protein
MHEYPEQIDCVWLASDRVGHVAAFITAGRGPIPLVILDRIDFDHEDVEPSVANLARVGDANLLVSVPRPDDFIAMAERGIFVYDWTDASRGSGLLRAYELVAAPLSPIAVTELPNELVSFIGGARFTQLEFSGSRIVDVDAHFRCERAQC